MGLTRRRFVGATVGLAGGGSAAARGRTTPLDPNGREPLRQTQVFRRFVVPSIEAFSGNYQGQFLFVDEATDEGPQAVDVGTCPATEWSDDETQVYSAQLLDRRQEEPITVDVEAYADGTKQPVSPSSFFVIDGAGQCAGDYVSLECEWVRRRSLVGKPPGPTVAETEADGQPGFGWVGTMAGVAGAAAFYVYRRLP